MDTLKVVIADDEERICQLIQALIDWKALGMEIAGVAHNGMEACAVVERVQPDILITDIRMPGCSGLELIEKVKEQSPELEIIIVSGYAHFEYAQQAIRFGVGYYLLKPVSKAELTAILEKLKNRIGERMESEQDKQELVRRAQRNDSRLRESLISRLLEDGELVLSEEILSEAYHVHIKPGLSQAFCLKMDCEENALGDSAVSILMEKAKEILERNLKEKCQELVLLMRDFYCVGIISYDSRQQEEIRRVLKNCLNQIELQKSIFRPVAFSMAAGTADRNVQNLSRSVKEAMNLIRERLVKGSGRLLERLGEPSALEGENLLEKYMREITTAIEVMSVEQADAAADFLQKETQRVHNVHGYELLNLVYSAAEIFATCIRMQERGGHLENLRKQCEQCKSAEELFACFREFQRQFLREIADRHEKDTVRPVRKAKEYIQSHYSEALTLEEISALVGLSTPYFSALFKKTEGEGFAKYLINVRMEQAKLLLRETNLPITEICRRVGYNDLKHFTHTFEKATEVKPSTYRKLYG